MIKRDGKDISSLRSKNIEIAKSTLEIVKQGKYHSSLGSVVELKKEFQYSIDNTKLVLETDQLTISGAKNNNPVVTVENEKANAAAQRLLKLGTKKIVALNFASATSPGGGFLGGSQAQEEDLCRASGLYPCLKNKPMFYNTNIAADDLYYNDNMIYSPDVMFFRGEYAYQMLDEPFPLSIITSPAPCLRNIAPEEVDEERVTKTLNQRAKRIFEVATANEHRTLILGAWGCGAFMNDPESVIAAFQAAMVEFPYFDHIHFAVYDDREPASVFELFKQKMLNK